MTLEQILIGLVGSEVCGQPAQDLRDELSPEMLKAVYEASKQQDIAHIAGQALERAGALRKDEISQKFSNQAVTAVYRHARMDREFQRICKTLSDAGIYHIPLKGAVLRGYYPQPWMRTSCDIDILVKEDMLEQAIAALTKSLGYSRGPKKAHDVSLFSGNGIHLELHYDLIEDKWPGSCSEILEDVWEAVSPVQPGGFALAMSDELFYFYHIAHMAKHFVLGGCGIRPFLDIWVLNHRVSYDREKRLSLLEQGQLLDFALAAEKLADHWFAEGQPDETTRQMTEYLFRGGLYGGTENVVSMRQVEKGRGLGYILSRIFLPFDQLRMEYPVLKKKKWLYPFCQVARWFRLLFGGEAGYWLRRLRNNASSSSKNADFNAHLLESLGLWEAK